MRLGALGFPCMLFVRLRGFKLLRLFLSSFRGFNHRRSIGWSGQFAQVRSRGVGVRRALHRCSLGNRLG